MKEKALDFDVNIKLTRIDKYTREVIDVIKTHNIITTDGLELVNDFLAGLAPTQPTHIAIGEGTTTEVVGDTTLETEQERESATISEPSGVSTEYTHEFSFGSGISYSITELGLLNNASGGVLFNRATFAARAVDDQINLIATVTVTVSQ